MLLWSKEIHTVLENRHVGTWDLLKFAENAEWETAHTNAHLSLSSHLGLYSDTYDTDVRTQEEVLYLSLSFPSTVPASQLATGNTASFNLRVCDSTKTCVTFVGGSETLKSVHLSKILSIFSTMHQSFVKLYFAFAQQIHNLHIQLISHLCALDIFLPFENLQATALTATESTSSLVSASGDLRQKPQISPHALFWKKRKQTKNYNQNHHQNQFKSTLH